MGQLSVTVITSLFLFVTYYTLVLSAVVRASTPVQSSIGAAETVPNGRLTNNERGGSGIAGFRSLPYAINFNRNVRSPFSNTLSQHRVLQVQKIPIEMDLLMDDDDLFDKSKRFDDYGHMRFGKRAGDDQFDDYGHMRFGKRDSID